MNKLVLSFALILIPLAGNAQVAVWKNCTQETIVQSANGEIERFTVFDTPDKFEEKSWHILTFVRQPILSKDWSPKTNPENQFRWSLRYSEQICAGKRFALYFPPRKTTAQWFCVRE